ncbi:MAG: DEAD/DEAH box helicase [Nanoarchaeota archaeon]
MEIKNFTPRLYQENILNTCKQKNTLVVLPTGTGKTKIAILSAIDRLKKFPNSKVLICTPTKPLSAQIYKEFIDFTTIDGKDVLLLTGAINPKKREKLWNLATVIVATPQTIQSDLKNNRISLENFSLLCIDEAHRSRLKYANTVVAKKYNEQSGFPKILALTASPGGTKEKIEEICNNLLIEAVEIRSIHDEDVKLYIQEKKIEWAEVELPDEFKKIKSKIKEAYDDKLKELKNFGLAKPLSLINRKDLLQMQIQLQKSLKNKNPSAFYGISITAQLLKLSHMLELIETQGITQLKKYWSKLLKEESKATKNIIQNKNIAQAIESPNIEIKHPKMIKLISLVQEQLRLNPKSKIIIFANYRDTVKEISSNLNLIKGIKAVELMGQKEGITQKQQISTVKDFGDEKYNCLVGTSVTEEGLDIRGGADLAIFYEPIPSEIRLIQRMGRVGRISKGKIIILITKGTRDVAYYWSSRKKERNMKKILYKMKQQNLADF